jgi:hypothetical protein
MAANNSFDGVFYCKEAPDVAERDGMFHVCYKVGGVNCEFVLTPNTFLKALRAANRAADGFHAAREGNVRNIRGKKGEH